MRLTEKQIAKRLAEGRGEGELGGYKPFIDHHDLSSLGRSSRVPSAKTGRLHHLFSDIERSAFLEFIRQPQVFDVREQFPLERAITRRIALEMGVPHPQATPGTDLVMTTDLVVVVRSAGKESWFARAAKPAGALGDKRTLEKLEIERRYWSERGVHWALVTDLDFSQQRRDNLIWLHGCEKWPEGAGVDYWEDRSAVFLEALRRAKDLTFAELENRLARSNFQTGDMVTLVRHFAWHGRIDFPLENSFSPKWLVSNTPLTRIKKAA